MFYNLQSHDFIQRFIPRALTENPRDLCFGSASFYSNLYFMRLPCSDRAAWICTYKAFVFFYMGTE